MSDVWSPFAGWFLFAGMTLATGATLARWTILPRAVGSIDAPASLLVDRAARLGSIAAATLPLAMGLYFLRQMEEFRDPLAPWSEDAGLLLSTAWGRSWIWATAGSVFAAAMMGLARFGKNAGWVLATAALLALGVFPGLTGHAAAAESAAGLVLATDALHVWAASGWIGGLATVLYLEWTWRRSEAGGSLLPALVPPFSTVAMICVGTLALTGTVSAWITLPDLATLFAPGYGRILLLKLAFVGVVLGLGGLNFRVLTPPLGSDAGDDAMRRSATIELMIAQVVLVITAILVRTSPLGH